MALCFTCAMVIGAFIVATEREKKSSHNVSPWGRKDRLELLCLVVNKLIVTIRQEWLEECVPDELWRETSRLS